MTVQVKVCGITRPEDALVAVRYGVHAIGLLFWSGSKRAVSLEQARAICEVIPPFVAVVGLFVDPKEEEVASALSAVPINLLQMHGSESPAFCRQWQIPYIKALKVQPGSDLTKQAAQYKEARGFLLDSVHDGRFGGTGQQFDWTLIPDNFARPIILAGGLNPATVGEAITSLRPSAVDVSSGVEISPGNKDPEKIRQFMKAVKAAEKVVTT